MVTSLNLPVPFVAATMAAVVSFTLCPFLVRLAPRLGLMDAPDAGRKKHGRPIPLVGGIAVWIGAGVALLWADPRLLAAWVLVGSMGGVGLADDLLGLRPGWKLLLQFLLPSLAWGIGISISRGFPWEVFGIEAFTVLGALLLPIVVLSNAFNFTDNSNGQCAGLAVLTLSAEGVVFLMRGDESSAAIFLVFATAFLGFLPWNFPVARAFLGDCGSHMAGCCAALGSVPLIWGGPSGFSAPHHSSNLLGVALLFFIPLLDMAVAVGGRLRRGKAPWKGDLTHLSHRLVARGLKSAVAVAVLWFAALVTSAAGVLVLTWR